MSKQDRQGVRTPADLERKYDYKGFKQSAGSISEAIRIARDANATAAEALSTAKRASQSVTTYDGKIAELDNSVKTLGERLDSLDGVVVAVEAQSAYTAMMTDTLSATLTKDKISAWYAKSLWTADMVNNAVDKGVLTSDEATEIIG